MIMFKSNWILLIGINLVASISEICFYHNTVLQPAYLQCGRLKSNQQADEYELQSISDIQLGWNSTIPVLDYGLFTPFRRLAILSLNDANIQSLGPRAFFNLAQIRELSLYNNGISKIDQTTFTQLFMLRVLDLGQNKLTFLEDNTFSSLYPLERLVLKWNLIENVTKATLNGLRGLKTLDLRGNRIKFLTNNTFQDLFFLENLDLSHNAIDKIPNTLFANQRNLLTLNLNSNNLESIPGDLLKNTAQLQAFDVSNNVLRNIEESILNRTVVENFKFGRNEITHINATELLLHGNWLDEVDLDFNPWNCKSLKVAIDEFQKSQVYVRVGQATVGHKNSVSGIKCENSVGSEHSYNEV